MPHKIAVIGGDGIGPEVTSVALEVMRAAGADLETTDFRLEDSVTLRMAWSFQTDPGRISGYDAILLGAVGTPEAPRGSLNEVCY